jgi:hypothetical protein
VIDSQLLLDDLKVEVTKLEDDLRARCDAQADVDAPLKAQYEAARAQKRTALTYKAWRDEELTNVAVAWVLACVFVRFLEDNDLVETLHLAGPDQAGVARARDQHELFFRAHPRLTEREYLEHVFKATEVLPGMKEFFDRRHNPLWSVGPSGDSAREFVAFWRKTNPETGRPLHEFSDPTWATRFLGDIYQDLSEAARKRYALLQTPVFVEEFILDRTLTPAIETFGFREVRMIDPTCGSGHFLLGSFARLHKLWVEAEPAQPSAVLAQRALDQVFGVDLNPNVVAIARFRLLIAALRATGTKRLRDAFNFQINVTTGDALLHGRRFGEFEQQGGTQRTFDTEEVFRDELKHHYEVEDTEALRRILGQQYHAVVGNPPYITVKDKAVSVLYRDRYPSCHRKYSLSVPFMERFFDLAVKGDGTPQHPAGFVGQITANSFMKREFGKKLIEEYLPRWDLTHVLDTSGAYIPGHGTPTVILFGRNQSPISSTIRTVLGIAGEPATPLDPALGVVWQAIVRQIDEPGSVSEWMSAADSPRESFHQHPWSVGGGGASELKDAIDESCEHTLVDFVEVRRKKPVIGFGAIIGEEDAFSYPVGSRRAVAVSSEFRRAVVEGEQVRDWTITWCDEALFPYDSEIELTSDAMLLRELWALRTTLSSRRDFSGVSYAEAHRPFWEYHQIPIDRNRAPTLLTFSAVATHNHFSLNCGSKVFKQSAPIIKLRSDREEIQCALLGVLNSSAACFWMKQVFHNKGSTVDDRGARQTSVPFENFYDIDGTKLASFPIPACQPSQLPTALVQYSTAMQGHSPAVTLASWSGAENGEIRAFLDRARAEWYRHSRQMIAWQEELDWQVYVAFNLVEAGDRVSQPDGNVEIPPDGIELGQRAFEIVLARRVAAGDAQTTWFERHKDCGSKPTTELPADWPSVYRERVERRIKRIMDDANIRLIEQPEFKRRWNTEPWDEQFRKAAREWLLARLEGYFFEGQRVCELKDGFDPAAAGLAAARQTALATTNQLAGTAQTDAAFLTVAEQLMGGPGFSVPKLVRELVESAAVPFLPVQRYKPAGLRKRRDWEHIWDLQRKEDAIEAEVRRQRAEVKDEAELQKLIRAAQKEKLGDTPVPPKYAGGDFKKSVWWSLRGKLDVPKERWVQYPGAERTEDPSPVIAWAGWDHAQQARALAEYYLEAKQNYAFPPEKLKPLLAGLADLLPWLQQWHSAIDPAIGDSPARAIKAFLEAECHELGLTPADLEVVRLGN